MRGLFFLESVSNSLYDSKFSKRSKFRTFWRAKCLFFRIKNLDFFKAHIHALSRLKCVSNGVCVWDFGNRSTFGFFGELIVFFPNKLDFFKVGKQQTMPIFSRLPFKLFFCLTLLTKFKNWNFSGELIFFWKKACEISKFVNFRLERVSKSNFAQDFPKRSENVFFWENRSFFLKKTYKNFEAAKRGHSF